MESSCTNESTWESRSFCLFNHYWSIAISEYVKSFILFWFVAGAACASHGQVADGVDKALLKPTFVLPHLGISPRAGEALA
jgi:hypothetical protein